MKLPVSQIVVDHGLYPRTNVDPDYVDALIDAIRVGVELPSIVVEQKTNRLVDGFHRVTAMRRVGMKEIDVQLVRYVNDGAFFLDAVRRNSAHGRRFVEDDVLRIRRIAEGTLSLDPARVASSLTMTKARLTRHKLVAAGPAKRPGPARHHGPSNRQSERRAPVHTTQSIGSEPAFVQQVEQLTEALRSGRWPAHDLEARIALDELKMLITIELKKDSTVSTSEGRK